MPSSEVSFFPLVGFLVIFLISYFFLPLLFLAPFFGTGSCFPVMHLYREQEINVHSVVNTQRYRDTKLLTRIHTV